MAGRSALAGQSVMNVSATCAIDVWVHSFGLVAITNSLPATATPAEADGRWPARLWGVVAVLSIALLLDGFDVSAVGVALPSIGSDLHMSTTSLQWVVNGYVLGFGGFLLLGGRTADLLGRRRVLLIALAVFTVASLLGGLAHDPTLL